MIKVLGIKIIDRIKEAGLTQGILSRHASVITTRLGFHEVTEAVCSREAVIILHLKDDAAESEKLITELQSIGGIDVREVEFTGKDEAHIGATIDVLCVLVEREPAVISSVQKMLTAFGCNIRTRLGVNETFFGEPAGLIVLELAGDMDQRLLLEKDLRSIGRVHVRSVSFQ
jgi:hypothetical protein